MKHNVNKTIKPHPWRVFEADMTYCALKLISKQTGSSVNVEFQFQIITMRANIDEIINTSGYLQLYSM